MANTYTQLNIHVVFSVNGRTNLLDDNIRPELFKYISGILNNLKHYSLAVNGYKDHVHLFFEMHPDKALSDIVRIVKSSSSKWINDNKFIVGRFEWQKGYGGFSYSRSQRNQVIQYISTQEDHHRKRTFREEYLELLGLFKIDFVENYIFEFYD